MPVSARIVQMRIGEPLDLNRVEIVIGDSNVYGDAQTGKSTRDAFKPQPELTSSPGGLSTHSGTGEPPPEWWLVVVTNGVSGPGVHTPVFLHMRGSDPVLPCFLILG